MPELRQTRAPTSKERDAEREDRGGVRPRGSLGSHAQPVGSRLPRPKPGGMPPARRRPAVGSVVETTIVAIGTDAVAVTVGLASVVLAAERGLDRDVAGSNAACGVGRFLVRGVRVLEQVVRAPTFARLEVV